MQVSAARWDDVRVFLALYRHRTLSGAGRAVGLDASTLSRRLAALEDVLDARLFLRTRDGLAPTDAAERLFTAAEEMEAAHGRFLQDASDLDRLPEGLVRLSVPPGLAESFIAPVLVRLFEKYPRLRIEVDVSTQFVDLTRREADIALRTQRPRAGDLVSVKLGERRWTPMVGSETRERRKAVRSWSDLRWITWADDRKEFSPARWVTKHIESDAVVLRTSHFPTQVAAVAAGLGAALLPSVYARLAAVAPIRAAASLRASMSDLPGSETWLVGHRVLRAVPRVAAVWTFLLDEFGRFEQTP